MICGTVQIEEIAALGHDMKETHGKPATCTEDGYTSHKVCSRCGYTEGREILRTTGHSFGNWYIVTEATCSTKGNERRDCNACDHYESKEIVAKGHSWDGGQVTKDPNCSEEGVTTYTCTVCKHTKTESISKRDTHIYDNDCDEACNLCGKTRTVAHSYGKGWESDKDAHWHECTVCGDKTDNAAHTPGAAATEIQAQTCTVCGYVISPALNHTHKWESSYSFNKDQHWQACSGCEEKKNAEAHKWDDGKVTKEPTCEETGEMTYTCTVCGRAKSESMSETEHVPGQEATETEPQVCIVCGKVLVPATGPSNDPTLPPTEPVEPETKPCEPATKPEETGPTEPEFSIPTIPSQNPDVGISNLVDMLQQSPAIAVILLMAGIAILAGFIGVIVTIIRRR